MQRTKGLDCCYKSQREGAAIALATCIRKASQPVTLSHKWRKPASERDSFTRQLSAPSYTQHAHFTTLQPGSVDSLKLQIISSLGKKFYGSAIWTAFHPKLAVKVLGFNASSSKTPRWPCNCWQHSLEQRTANANPNKCTHTTPPAHTPLNSAYRH